MFTLGKKTQLHHVHAGQFPQVDVVNLHHIHSGQLAFGPLDVVENWMMVICKARWAGLL